MVIIQALDLTALMNYPAEGVYFVTAFILGSTIQHLQVGISG